MSLLLLNQYQQAKTLWYLFVCSIFANYSRLCHFPDKVRMWNCLPMCGLQNMTDSFFGSVWFFFIEKF